MKRQTSCSARAQTCDLIRLKNLWILHPINRRDLRISLSGEIRKRKYSGSEDILNICYKPKCVECHKILIKNNTYHIPKREHRLNCFPALQSWSVLLQVEGPTTSVHVANIKCSIPYQGNTYLCTRLFT